MSNISEDSLAGPSFKPLTAVPVVGVVDGVNKRYSVPSGGSGLVVVGGVVIQPGVGFSMDGGTMVLTWAPETESEKPVVYLFE